jgi:RING-type zinc-finger
VITVTRIPHAAPQLLLPFLTAYESKSQSSKFNLASHPCNVCFETVKGSRCLQFICGHIFCRACLRDGWSLYIAEGDVVRVGCLDPQCVKDEQEATEDEVRMVVTEEEVHRWKWLREKKAAERGAFISHIYPDAHCLQILLLYCVQWFSVKSLCRNRRVKTTLAGKGCERVPRATTHSVHFAREHGECATSIGCCGSN